MKAALLLCATTAFALDAGRVQVMFDQWTRENGKKYSSQAELELRRANFAASLEEITRLNAKGEAVFRPNKYSDLSAAERKGLRGFRAPGKEQLEAMGPRVGAPKGTVAPKSVDWRTTGIVQAVKDQGQCGSCWAFSAISNVESRIAMLKKTNASSYAEQLLVDCDQTCGQYRQFNGCDAGCNGGLQPNAWTYLRDNALVAESDYPYTAQDGTCQKPGRSDGLITGFEMINQNEDDIMNIVATKGPVAIAVDASSWSFYSGGIMKTTCQGSTFFDLDHAVNIVGYGTDADGTNFWIVRNSWGADWGENGYVRVIRGTNECGINFFACAVTLKQ